MKALLVAALRVLTVGFAMSAAAVAQSGDTASATPRLSNGNPNLGPLADGQGFWDRGSGPMVGGAAYPDADEIPFKPWARALYDYRQQTLARDDPHARCAPPGGPRQFAVPFGLQIIQVPEIQRIFVLSGGSVRPWREIYMDGRAHPEGDFLNPSYFGHSVGHWEGDTLVVDTVGFNERFWMHREGFPHTEAMHLVERISRPDVMTLDYEITIDDPLAYDEPWTTRWSKSWSPGQDFIEYFCHDNNRDQYHLVGDD